MQNLNVRKECYDSGSLRSALTWTLSSHPLNTNLWNAIVGSIWYRNITLVTHLPLLKKSLPSDITYPRFIPLWYSRQILAYHIKGTLRFKAGVSRTLDFAILPTISDILTNLPIISFLLSYLSICKYYKISKLLILFAVKMSFSVFKQWLNIPIFILIDCQNLGLNF